MSSPQNNVAKIYVAIDCLMDMRLGALTLLDDKVAFEISTKDQYYLREEDLFSSPLRGVLSKEILNKLLKQKADLILRNSLRTKMHRFVHDLALTLKEQSRCTPYHTDMAIEVNVYPCTLTQLEGEALLEMLRITIGENFSISLVTKSESELTYRYVKENYRCMVMYNYYDWMNLYNQDIKKSPLKDTCFYIPKLYFGTPPTKEQLEELSKHNTNPFSFMEEAMKPLAPIQFLPIALYCADIPMNKEIYSKN